MQSILEALEREVSMGIRLIPRAVPRSLKVAFISAKAESAPEERRNEDFVASIAKALELRKTDYVLAEPLNAPSARLWIFFGELPIAQIEADEMLRTETIGKLVENIALKKDLWLRLKVLKDSLLQRS